LKYDLLNRLKSMLNIEMGRCPLSNDECMRLIGKHLGDPRIDKSTERKLEAIPKFSGTGTDTISITDFLERVSKVSKQEPTLTKIYYLKLRLDGFLQTTVEDMEAKGLTFEEIVARLRRKYSRQTEQVWTEIA
jgi:hypothetical protein